MRRAPRELPRSPERSPVVRCPRSSSSAGTRPKKIVVAAVTARPRPRARRLIDASPSRGISTGVRRTMSRQRQSGGRDPERRAGDGQHEALGQQLRDQLPRRRAKRDAHRDLTLAGQRTRQEQRRDVEAADQQQQSRPRRTARSTPDGSNPAPRRAAARAARPSLCWSLRSRLCRRSASAVTRACACSSVTPSDSRAPLP